MGWIVYRRVGSKDNQGLIWYKHKRPSNPMQMLGGIVSIAQDQMHVRMWNGKFSKEPGQWWDRPGTMLKMDTRIVVCFCVNCSDIRCRWVNQNPITLHSERKPKRQSLRSPSWKIRMQKRRIYKAENRTKIVRQEHAIIAAEDEGGGRGWQW